MNSEQNNRELVEETDARAGNPDGGSPVKKSLARRIAKVALWTIGGLLAFVLVALLTLPLWVNPVGTSIASVLVPKYTGTAFNVDRIDLNPYSGKLLISGVKLANPEGYAEADAFAFGSVSAEVEVSSLMSKTIHVVDVTIDSPYASYVFDAEGTNNFDRIIAEVNKKLGPKEKDEDEEPSETKVVVDKVTIKNVRVVVANGTFEIATLTLSDFGKDSPAKLELAGAKLVNPKGFPEPNAFSLKSLSIGMETADLSKRPMVFHDIIVDSTYAGYVYNDAGEGNFDVMFKPLTGGDDDEDGKDAEKDKEKDEEKEKAEEEEGGMRVVIDKLDISGTKLQYRAVALPIPLPTFTDIGKTSDEGATPMEVADQVLAKAQEAVGGVGGIAGMFGASATNLLGNAAGFLGTSATNLLGNATDLVSGGVSNVLGGASSLIDGASAIVGGSTSNALNSAKGAIGGAVDGAKGLLDGVLPGGDKKKDDGPSAADKAAEGAKNALKKLGTGGGLFGN